MPANDISRRTFLKAGAASSLAFMMPMFITSRAQAANKKPNIIFLLTDDQRWDTLGCYGNEYFKTPNIDYLAREGVLFENVFYSVSICMGSRASIFQGQYLSRHRCSFDSPTDWTISREELNKSYPVVLRKAGYRTGFIGKLGFAVTDSKVREGRKLWNKEENMPKDAFDYWKGWTGQVPKGGYYPEKYKGKHLTEVVGDQINEFIQTNPKDQPFCLSVSFHAPKGGLVPDDVDPRYRHIFEDVVFPYPDNYIPGDNHNLPDVIKGNWRGYLKYHKNYTYPDKYQAFIRRQAGLVYGVDVVIGRLLQELAAQGIEDNTIIIYTSDNGFFNGSKGLDGKVLLYEESIRAPLIVFDPRLSREKRGQRRHELINTIDLAPSMVDMGGVSIPATMQGQSVIPLIHDQRISWRDYIYTENNFTNYQCVPLEEAENEQQRAYTQKHSTRCRAIRTEKYKYIIYHELDPVFEELYDLKSDPLEQINLVDNPGYASILNDLRKECQDMMEQVK